jgi:hypothetical protein
MRVRLKAVWSLAVALSLCLVAVSASAQTATTGSIAGTVTDAQGGVLPGATVTATHADTGTNYESVTDATGHFSILNVRVGRYSVAVTMSGFKDQKQESVDVQLGVERAVDFKLQLATVSETVNVIAESPFDAAGAGTAENVAQAVIESLPTINRSITDFARVSPFVNPTTLGSSGDQAMSIGGRHNRYNNMQIDGAVNNDLFGLADTGTPGGQTGTQPISLDAIQEIQVVVSPYDVRQGGFSGGGVNVVTKSGTNSIGGTAYLFGRNENLIGGIPAIKTVSNPNPSITNVGNFSDKQSGFSLGGPIVKNKAFYFGNADFQRKSTPVGFSVSGNSGQPWGSPADQAAVQTVVGILKNQYGFDPGGLDEFSRPLNNDKVFVRTDFNLSANNRLTGRVNYVNGLQYVGGSSNFSYVMPDQYYSIQDKTLSSVGQLDTTLSNTMFNQARVTYQRERNVRGDQPGFSAFPSVEVDFPSGNNMKFGTETSSQANRLNQDIVEINDDLTWVKGTHQINIGTHNELFKFYNLFIQNFYGTYRFTSVANFQAGLAQSFQHNFSNDPNNPLLAAQFSVQQYGFYAGDLWRVKPNLSINYGARLDIPHFPDKPHANPLALSDFGYATDVVPAPKMFSPRIGFNWDLSHGSNNRAQLRGGVGSFAGRTPYVWLSNQYGNTGVDFTALSVPFNQNNPAQVPFVADPHNQPTTVTGGAAGRQTINMIDPKYKYPQILRGNIGYDHMLPMWGLIGTAEFLWSKTQHDVLWKNLNWVPTGHTLPAPDGRLLYQKFDPNINDAVLLTNTNQGDTESIAFKVERPYRHGFYASGSYLYGRARTVSDGGAFVALSSWRDQYVNYDLNNPPLARSIYSPGNRVVITGSFDVPMWHNLHSVASAFYSGQTGQPYSQVYNGDANGDTTSFNDLAFIPASADQVVEKGGTWDQLNAYLSSDPAAKNNRGMVPNRNTGTAPWTNELDARYQVTVPVGRTKVDASFSVLNFLNLLNNTWGVHYFPNFNDSQFLGWGGLDAATGKPTINISGITSPGFQGTFSRDDLRSRWQAQWELRVRF